MSSHELDAIGVEPEGLSFTALFGSMAVSVLVIVALVIGGMAYAGYRFQDAKLDATQTTGYPILRETNTMGASKLSVYGKTENGRYIIPIERAMELEAQEAGQ